MKRFIPLLAFVLLLSAALLYWRTQNLAKESDISPGTVDATAPLPDPGTQPPAPSAGIPPVPSPSGVEPSFVNYLQAEARSINAPSVNAAAAEKNIAEQAARMGENEIRYARDLALGPQNPANQRILAAFLLGAAGAKARGSLRELILVTFNSNRAEADSIDELKNTQTKAISMMAVDALADQAAKDPAARAELERLAGEVKDETLKKHIQQRLRDLPPR
jgi:hypothetical protein